MSFFAAAGAYDAFMGRYSARLAVEFADFAGVTSGQHVVDVGAGTGTLTAELLRRGATVMAADPSQPFADAIGERYPNVDVRRAAAEDLPFADSEFDAALAQLVVSFMSNPVAGIREMARVTRPGGVVAACVWDVGGDRAPFSPVWTAARTFGADGGEEKRPGTQAGQLPTLFEQAGLTDVEGGEVSVRIEHGTFDEWWEPFTYGAGPVGAFVQQLDDEQLTALVAELRRTVGDPPSGFAAVAWAARGRVPSELR